MPIVDFSMYPYYPALQRSPGEHYGYRKLSDEDKDALLPIFEISQRRFDEVDFDAALTEIAGSVENRPFILDLCHDPAPAPFVPKGKPLSPDDKARIKAQAEQQDAYNGVLAQTLDPTNGFAAWRAVVSAFPQCIPVIQFTDAQSQARNILRQGALLAANGSLAIRLTPETHESIFQIIGQVLAVLESTARLLIILDCGQGRQGIETRADFARQSIAKITSELDVLDRATVRAVCMSNSFPQLNHDLLKVIENLDTELWYEASDVFPFYYGDYAATRRARNSTMYVPADWRATVVYPLDTSWIIYRAPNAKDADGWITGAQEIRRQDGYGSASDTWGKSIIERAAKGDIEEVNSTRFWYAAKVNMHIHRQLEFSTRGFSADDSEDS